METRRVESMEGPRFSPAGPTSRRRYARLGSLRHTTDHFGCTGRWQGERFQIDGLPSFPKTADMPQVRYMGAGISFPAPARRVQLQPAGDASAVIRPYGAILGSSRLPPREDCSSSASL